MKRGKTMKKLTKTFIAVAAVSTVSAVMAASAMAMTATYADGKLTLTDVPTTGTSQTLLVLSEDTTVTSENANSIVKQIDQKDNNETFAAAPVQVGELGDGTYYVRIGGSDGNLYKATFTIGSVEPGTTMDIIIGDIDGLYGVDSDDLTALARAMVDLKGESYGNATVGVTYKLADGSGNITVGDIDGQFGVDSDDLTALARAMVDLKSEAYGNATVGNTVKVESTPVSE